MGTDNLARWTIYSYKFARERLVLSDCFVNAFGLPIGIVVLRAGYACSFSLMAWSISSL